MRAWMLAVSLVSFGAALLPTPVQACRCARRDYVHTIPVNSESGVPRNQAIVLEGPLQPDTIALLDRDGRPHPFATRAFQRTGPCGGEWWVELIPLPALEANARYELRVAPAHPPSDPPASPHVVRFTTGSEFLLDPKLAPPTGTLTLIEAAEGASSSCGKVVGSVSIRVDDPTDVEVVLRDGDRILNEYPLRQADWSFNLWTMPTCIELVRHAATGRRSKPLSFCGKELKPRPRASPEASPQRDSGVGGL